ncbi:glycoside hydrolase domain-containing protein [Phytoactinopolyspora limicola]|uniref:glycoside hydrolase domain-containing protein n=1 Tax=Phytoactinopolyspora limicola TaxID=2715536 RepID=UPI00140A125E|nr:glycoside hydrolase domain-containing protein [Phytoactinopolyspora limicola]
MTGHGCKTRLAYIGVGVVVAASAVLGPTTTASAVPSSDAVHYPEGSSATRATGPGFDTCVAPGLDTLRAWTASEYTTVNVYIGGVNRSCRQPHLTRSWVQQATAIGWYLLPTYVGRQPRCVIGTTMGTFPVSGGNDAGRNDAADAVQRAGSLGLLPGSAIYADIEHYDHSDLACRGSVADYVSGWSSTLHRNGYLAGVYVHHASGLRDVVANYNSPHHTRPDAVWMAQWDGKASLGSWPGTPADHWARQQRVKQYRGEHAQTWGGATLHIDSNVLDAPVATVAREYRVTSTVPLNARTGPATSYPVAHRHPPGTTLSVVCQGRGQTIGGTQVWNRLSSGAWVSDHYVSTPSSGGFSEDVPRCTYPGQVHSGIPLNTRSGPGTSHDLAGDPLPHGSLAWVTCQARGSDVFGSSVWNQLADGRWVSDHYVSTRSSDGWSTPIPRCPGQ